MRKFLIAMLLSSLLASPAHAISAYDWRIIQRNATNTAFDTYDTHLVTPGVVNFFGTSASTNQPASFVFGTGAGNVAQGNDSRFSDARTPLAHNHPASDIVSGVFADARISSSSVLQHEAALTIAESQIPNLVTDLASKYDASNPAGYITSSALSGYATSSAVASGYVAKTVTVNGQALSGNVTLTATDVGAGTSSFSGAYADLTGKPSLATVATSGAYADLSGKPTLFSGAYTDLTGKPSLATVATSGAYADLSGKPTIPSAQVNSDWSASSGVAQVLNKPTVLTKAYDGTTLRSNVFPVFKSATVASGVGVFHLTDDGTSTGAALCPNGVIESSLNFYVSDATTSFQVSHAFSNSNKTLTATTNKYSGGVTGNLLNIVNILLGQAQGNGATLRMQVYCY